MIKVGSFKMDDPAASQQQGAANNDPSPPRSTPSDGDRPAQGSGSLQIDMQQIQAAEARSESDEAPPQVTDTFTATHSLSHDGHHEFHVHVSTIAFEIDPCHPLDALKRLAALRSAS